ncbi:MAG: hypothetical protein JHD16_02465 [Solirubrobacteraceae bacterium]|nr:hypothetical protein [Solirubrobacteraceae bacterium]
MVRRTLAVAILATAAAFGVGAAPAAAATDATGRTGEVRFVKRMTPADDKHVTGNNPAKRAWLNDKFWRTEVFAPFFDGMTGWYGQGWVYSDLYAIYPSSKLATEHPEWILRDAAGNKLFIPWGCSNGTCPQYAADITNPAFRADWIAKLKGTLAKGYKGAWIDDVNLERRVGNGNGTEVAPVSPALGRAMSADDWRKAMASFTEQIRREIPNHELLHNSIWYAGQGAGREKNPDVQRQIASADYINLERGVTDGGLTGGTGEWSLKAVHAFADQVHAQGKGLIIDSWESTDADREYSLANYLLLNNGADGVGDMSQSPDAWWQGWDADLGTATTGRYDWQGVIRRDFTGGTVLVNEPGAPTRTVTLSKPMVTVDGRTVTQVSVSAKRGVVLRGEGAPAGSTTPGTTTPAPGTPTPGSVKPPKGTTTPQTGTGSTGTTTPAADKNCTIVRVTYPTLRWDAKKNRLVTGKGSAKVCIPTHLKKGTKAHKSALKKAKIGARKASIAKAKAARLQAVRAAAARA